ncbi:MAG: FIST N-terminal domain-containing protein [Bacteroidota bacterium]
MRIEQFLFKNKNWLPLTANTDTSSTSDAQIVFCFGERCLLHSTNLDFIFQRFPNAQVVSASTAGEIALNNISQHTLVCTAVTFQKASVITQKVNIANYSDSKSAGMALVRQFEAEQKEELKLILILSDGQLVNGSDLLAGINEQLTSAVPVVGGLAGDGTAFRQTTVGLGTDIATGNITAVGFYGSHLDIGYGSAGGWESFGPTRVVTKAEKNILYEIDGKSALDLYTRYLGEYANNLPGSALLFPLAVQPSEQENPLVRTILSIDRNTKSMTFAGNIPIGAKVQLMRAGIDDLAEAAANAAEDALQQVQNPSPNLAILISCVGRKIVFDQRIEEEWEEINNVLPNTALAGFYSYGEISPHLPLYNCQLYNQTMTITTISESL